MPVTAASCSVSVSVHAVSTATTVLGPGHTTWSDGGSARSRTGAASSSRGAPSGDTSAIRGAPRSVRSSQGPKVLAASATDESASRSCGRRTPPTSSAIRASAAAGRPDTRFSVKSRARPPASSVAPW
ncbi:MAG TPA: hypothetical protein VHF89_02560 [Solirubrobacteraceae bacterium]|nr:hypothetical protein [Solirubrobacteraceae bacterium]